jgi:DNA processing protein
MMKCSRASKLWLQLLSIEGISPSRWVPLVLSRGVDEIARRLGSESGRSDLARLLGRRPGKPRARYVEEQLEKLRNEKCGLLSISEAGYPSLLREIHDPPPLLYLRGDPVVLGLPALCIVGSRSAGRRGALTARGLAAGLSMRGIMVVSGLARGIDRAAHEGALEGGGPTCAVLGCGLDICYPPENGPLAGRIERRGTVLSELPFGTPPLRHNFPRRNRILSGLSLGVVVVEAGIESGAMVTARMAREQDREIFAVPGPVEKPLSRGPHALLRNGAHLVETVEDILAQLPPCGSLPRIRGGAEGTPAGGDLSDLERRVVDALELDPKHIDELVRICNISPTSLLPVLLNLEMRGRIVSCGGGSFALPAQDGGYRQG